MDARAESTESLLTAAYGDLEFSAGNLLQAAETPTVQGQSQWTRHGGWLALAKKVGAECVFFVDDNPVVVFVDGTKARGAWQTLFNRTWCLARPPLLFLALPGELAVYDLSQPPVRGGDSHEERETRLLGVAKTASEVLTCLGRYHRSQVEGGVAFANYSCASGTRADRAIVEDLRRVRTSLLSTGMSMPRAHALIGRSLFIRYLEDRRILVEDYYRKVAGKNRAWNRLLDATPVKTDESDKRRPFYTSVLRDRDFAVALFEALARDFNGDLFPLDSGELRQLTQSRLDLVRRLLMGEVEGEQLFFFAYDFEIVPIDLISSIYEEFLKVEKGRSGTQGSFYTPGALVDFVLSRTLDNNALSNRPRIIDPACGSGIFLVEAFQRLIRHRMGEVGRRLRPAELRKILREQIAGIDVNEEAVRVAAFSLYLALLNHLDPPDILGHKLPTLTYVPGALPDRGEDFNILVAANAFGIDKQIDDPAVRSRFGTACADVVVGNPPWGKPREEEPGAIAAARMAIDWCADRGKVVGDKELSQAFIHRAGDMLRPGGRVGLLVSTGVFLKRADQSREFRRQWLSTATLSEVVNFAAVRHVFFTGRGRSLGAIAPFASVVFTQGPREKNNRFRYYSAKETSFVSGLQAVLLALPDLHVVSQDEFCLDDDLWKVYWWGGHRDAALVRALREECTLGEIIDPEGSAPERFGSGFKESKKNRKVSTALKQFQELPPAAIKRYGPLPTGELVTPPLKVERERDKTIYEGSRLIVRRGIMERDGAMGRIVARLATEPFCFKHSVYGIRLPDAAIPHGRVLLGTLWSSLVRYFAWMSSGSWGMWHHEILQETVSRLPVRVNAKERVKRRIESVVERLQKVVVDEGLLFSDHPESLTASEVRELEKTLDDAVFDLFDLSEAERDLIRDMCDVGLELFYHGKKSDALKRVEWPLGGAKSGHAADVAGVQHSRGLGGYIQGFLDIWDRELAPDGWFSWQVVGSGTNRGMIGVIFRTEARGDRPTSAESCTWDDIFRRYEAGSRHPFGSGSIYIDGMARIVAEHEIVIIKKDDARLWTRTAGREDADATLLQAMERQQLSAPGVSR